MRSSPDLRVKDQGFELRGAGAKAPRLEQPAPPGVKQVFAWDLVLQKQCLLLFSKGATEGRTRNQLFLC